MPLLGKDIFFSGPAQDAVWSPNSQYVALNVRNSAPGDDASTDIFIYSLSSNTLTRLTADNLRDYRIAWSPDSARIVTTIQECFSIETSCIYRIAVFNITNTSPIISVDISDVVNTHGGRNSTCLLNWSPDGRYVSFFAGCQESISPTSRSEVWMLDTTDSSVDQVTNYTADYSLNPTGAIVAIYDTVWYDAQTLLIGVAVTRDNNVANNRTAILAYRTTDRATTLLSSNSADYLTVNPVSQEIAYRAIPSFDTQLIPQTPSVQISIFNGSALSTAVNTTGACKLAWQPNGEILASVRYEGTQCRDTVEALTFINRANSSILDHTPPANGGGTSTFITPIGWVSIQTAPPIICNFNPADFNVLRTAITSANGNGTPDTICLSPTGNYTMTDAPAAYNADGSNGLPSITSDITIIGNGGAATIARGTTSTNFRLLRVATGGSLTLNNVIVQGGNAPSTAGGGIRNSGTLNLVNSRVQNNAAGGGAGIYNLNGTVNLSAGSMISNNISSANGGGIRNNGGTLTIADSTISNNSAASASSNGGGIYNNGGGLTIQGSTTISGNSARLGGGVYIGDTGASTASIDMGVIISSNTAANNGGGVYINSGTTTIGNPSGGLVTVGGNVATNSGSGIYHAGGNLTLRYCAVSNNGSISANSGGGLRAEGTLTVNNCSFTNNLVNTSTGLGAGIYINAATPISITNTAISNVPGTAAARNGAGMFITGTSTLTIAGSTFTGNRAQHNGGGLFLDLGNIANITTSTFNNNSAVDQGGAIANYGTLALTTSNLTNNNGGTYGGALVNDNSTTGDSIHQSCISGNVATNGSAIYSFSATFNAENNWWGVSSGAGTSINSNVDAVPFLSSCPNG
jgi:hypothetical protein